jgi:flagellar brake protein
MNQIDVLSELTIDKRFLIAGRRPLAFMLAGLARSNVRFSLLFNTGREMFLTTLIAVDVENEQLYFDCSGSLDANRDVLASERNIFVGTPGGVKVQFTTGPVTEVMYEGGKAFTVSLPKVLIRLQRRDYFRIETPRIRPLQCFGRLPEGDLLKLAAHDVSVDGVGLTAPQLPEGLEPGLAVVNCHLALPDQSEEIFFAATVRHLSELETRPGVHQWRIGLQFNKLPPADGNHIQRYIARLERERHELA